MWRGGHEERLSTLGPRLLLVLLLVLFLVLLFLIFLLLFGPLGGRRRGRRGRRCGGAGDAVLVHVLLLLFVPIPRAGPPGQSTQDAARAAARPRSRRLWEGRRWRSSRPPPSNLLLSSNVIFINIVVLIIVLIIIVISVIVIIIIVIVATAITLATAIIQCCFRNHVGTGMLDGTGHGSCAWARATFAETAGGPGRCLP